MCGVHGRDAEVVDSSRRGDGGNSRRGKGVNRRRGEGVNSSRRGEGVNSRRGEGVNYRHDSLPTATYCYLLLPTAIYCYLLLPTATYCYLPIAQGKLHDLEDLERISVYAARHIVVLGPSITSPRAADSLVITTLTALSGLPERSVLVSGEERVVRRGW